ncbi:MULTISPECIES: LuxR C-terminal-related transcriptional regulator [unclassified Actinotalea]|uniref:helix-turn-helix transcriptional regulator n=1 Tax=unclassified Actinotalea TaxID=2638618 RepID=UPI0015F462BA|nr:MULTISPECIES: LuxR C-terminal-related transcriptional regulator [unclassified Actinotalea]
MSASDARAVQVDAVRQAVSAGTSVSVVGLPGSGRTALLAGLKDSLEAEGWNVVVLPVAGSGSELRRLEGLLLAGVTPTQTAANPLAAVLESLLRAAARAPAALLLDDADRLDDASAAVLAAVVARQGAVVVATIRPPYPGARSVDRILAGRAATVLWLPALSFEVVHRIMVEELAGDVDTDVAARVYALSGGLPGIARAIVREARRAGHLVRRDGGWWQAVRDLWTPALAVVVGRLQEGCGEDEHRAMQVLALMGPTEVRTVTRLLPWSAVVALDDRGIARFVESPGALRVALFPPLLSDHLRQTGHGARGRAAVDLVQAALGREDDPTLVPDLPTAPPGAPRHWASSPESAAVLGRVLREQARSAVLVCRDAWEQEPTGRTTVLYLDALLAAGGHEATIEAVLAATRSRMAAESADLAFVRVWEAGYQALNRHDPVAALRVLGEARADAALDPAPVDTALFDATEQHIRLVLDGVPPRAPGLPPLVSTAPEDLGAARRGDPLGQVDDVTRTIRAELLLARGQVVTARREAAAVAFPAESPRRDDAALVPLAELCSGDVDAAITLARRLLDQAQGSLDQAQIEPQGHVLALGLFLQGRLGTLRTHLTSMLAINAPTPQRPTARAGLLNLAAMLALVDGEVATARSIASQVEAFGLLGAPYPLTRSGPVRAGVALASGAGLAQAAGAAWEAVDDLVERGYVLAATFEAACLVGMSVDATRAARVCAGAVTAEGTLLPLLGGYVHAATSGSPTLLLTAADDLRSAGLGLLGTVAHAVAVRALRADGAPAAAARESARLRLLVGEAGDGLDLLLPTLSRTRELTARELEIARLVADGLTNREIGQRLVLSERTVDNHLYRLFRKLGVASRDEIATML